MTNDPPHQHAGCSSCSGDSSKLWIIFFAVFTCLGVSLGIVGPSIYFFEISSILRMDDAALMFTGRAVGGMAGWLLSVHVYSDAYHRHDHFCISFGLFLLTISNLLTTCAQSLWSLMPLCALEGFSITFTMQGILAGKSQKRHAICKNILAASIILGCALSNGLVSCSLEKESHGSTIISDSTVMNQGIAMPLSVSDAAAVAAAAPAAGSTGEKEAKLLVRKARELMPPRTTVKNITSMLTKTTTSATTTIVTVKPITVETKELIKSTTPDPRTSTNNSTTTVSPKKPSMVDASKLSQDANTVDGTKTASEMKKAVDSQRVADALGKDTIPVKIVSNDTTASPVSVTTGPAAVNSPSNNASAVPVVQPKLSDLLNEDNEQMTASTLSLLESISNRTTSSSKSSSAIVPVDASQEKPVQPAKTTLQRLRHLSGQEAELPFQTLARFFNRPMTVMQKIYLLLSLVTFCAWVLLLPFTGPFGKKMACCQLKWSKESASGGEDEEENIPMLSSACFTIVDSDYESEKEEDDDEAQRNELVEAIPQWPQIHLPDHMLLLVANFVHSGLETAYGGFIHSFSMIYLNSTQRNALLVCATFWFCNFLTRLFLALPVVSWLERKSALDNFDTSRGKLLVPIARLVGACVCLLSTALMVHNTVSPLMQFLAKSDDDSFVRFRNAYWYGSAGMGIGLGLTGGIGFHSSLNEQDSIALYMRKLTSSVFIFDLVNHSEALQICAFFGQMIIPAVAGYLHRHIDSERASSALGLTALCLSSVLTLCLMCDFCVGRKRSNSSGKSTATIGNNKTHYDNGFKYSLLAAEKKETLASPPTSNGGYKLLKNTDDD